MGKWPNDCPNLKKSYGIFRYECIITNGSARGQSQIDINIAGGKKSVKMVLNFKSLAFFEFDKLSSDVLQYFSRLRV